MLTKNRMSLFLALALTVLSSLSCGKKDKDGVTVKVVPDRPIVITADRPIADSNPNDEVDDSLLIKGPWFQYRFSVTNASTKTITLLGMKGTVTGSLKGQRVEGTIQDSVELDDGVVLAEVAAGETYSSPITFFIHSLPEVDSGGVYEVTMTFQGWIGDRNTPEDNLIKELRFITRPTP